MALGGMEEAANQHAARRNKQWLSNLGIFIVVIFFCCVFLALGAALLAGFIASDADNQYVDNVLAYLISPTVPPTFTPTATQTYTPTPTYTSTASPTNVPTEVQSESNPLWVDILVFGQPDLNSYQVSTVFSVELVAKMEELGLFDSELGGGFTLNAWDSEGILLDSEHDQIEIGEFSHLESVDSGRVGYENFYVYFPAQIIDEIADFSFDIDDFDGEHEVAIFWEIDVDAATVTLTPSATWTPSPTATASETKTPTATHTASPSPTATLAPSATAQACPEVEENPVRIELRQQRDDAQMWALWITISEALRCNLYNGNAFVRTGGSDNRNNTVPYEITELRNDSGEIVFPMVVPDLEGYFTVVNGSVLTQNGLEMTYSGATIAVADIVFESRARDFDYTVPVEIVPLVQSVRPSATWIPSPTPTLSPEPSATIGFVPTTEAPSEQPIATEAPTETSTATSEPQNLQITILPQGSSGEMNSLIRLEILNQDFADYLADVTGMPNSVGYQLFLYDENDIQIYANVSLTGSISLNGNMLSQSASFYYDTRETRAVHTARIRFNQDRDLTFEVEVTHQ